MKDDPRQLTMKCEEVAMESSRPTKSVRLSPQRQSSFICYSMSIPNLSRIVGDLLECESANDLFCRDDSILSLEAAIHDIHLLLREPQRFLFESNYPLKTCTKMYGRSSEAKALTDAFCRVASSGLSEAFVIGGFSGSGKTRLVRSVCDSVIAANGMLVNGKFEETSTDQLSIVLSAFDDICILLAGSNSTERSQEIWQLLHSEFGASFHLLVRTLPHVLRLSPSSWAAFSCDYDVNSGGEVNFFSLCDIIKRFMRVVSSSSCPVMLFLDDVQWADQVSLGLVYSVLSEINNASCMLFVGSYRDNEVSQNHILYEFYDRLSAFHVPLSTIHLDGVTEDETNSMVADALGMLPRMCRSISQVVFRKTKGNPFFVQTFLRSLVDKCLLTYSLREKSWTWDIDEIYAENITPNVLDLISVKMAHLPQSGQTALKVASCFGIKIHMSIVKDLSETPQYSSLFSDLNKAVEDDFMDLDADGSYYRFVHDKEALNTLVKHADSLETKLDAYELQQSILFNRFDPNEMGQLLVTVIDILMSLGENVTHEDIATKDISNQVFLAKKRFDDSTDEILLHMQQVSSKNHVAIMQAYSILVAVVHIVRPKVFPYFAARWAQFCLQHRVACKHVAAVYVTFAIVLCGKINHQDIQVGRRIGKLGLKLLNESDSCIYVLPSVHLFYYGYIGILFEPIQVCIEMHRMAYDIGLQVGNISIAALHKLFMIFEQLHSGKNLQSLKQELEREMKMAEHYCSFPVVGTKLQAYYEAVSALIGEKSRDLSHQHKNSETRMLAYSYGQIMASTFLGHFERAKHMATVLEESRCNNQGIILIDVYVRFYHGLASIALQRRRKWRNPPKNTEKLIEVVQNASVCSEWNFKNKVSLLMAEKFSLCLQDSEAEVEYDVAISAAQSSKFIHEEGLACELAGAHHERLGKIEKA
ncbi:hypothetical protein ACHAW6_004062, partial [Cyclotella cf. meneghiniana]